MKKHYFILSILFFSMIVCQSQTLQDPELKFTQACISESYNSFEVGFSFTEASFNSDNVFYIELSDGNGGYTNLEQLATVTDKNSAFEFTLSLELPETLSGDGYTIRIRSTSPAMTSNASAAFNAYFVPSTDLILNNYEVSSLCASEETMLELNEDVAETYIWYKNGQFYSETQEPYLTVNTAGQYYVEPYLGACSGSLFSNIVTVESMATIDVALNTATDISFCDGEEVTLGAATADPALVYEWFRDGVLIEGSNVNTSTLNFVASPETYGDYYLKATNEFGCSATSETITVKNTGDITLSTQSPLNSVILGDAVANLHVQSNKTGLEVIWFKDGVEVGRGTDMFSYAASTQGDYHAMVTDPGGCGATKISDHFNVYEPVSFTASIAFGAGYAACESSSASIAVKEISGTLDNGDTFVVDPSMYYNFSMTWKRDGEPTGVTTSVIDLTNHTASGAYSFVLGYEGSAYESESLDAYIGLPAVNIVQQNALTCSQSAVLTVEPFEDVIYNWYLNDTLVATGLENEFEADTAGTYFVEMEYMGCVATAPEKEISSEADALVSIYPGERVALVPDEVVEIVASGGEQYTWTNAAGEVISQSEMLTVDNEGTYHVRVTIGGCVVEKSVEVYFNLASAIPNVVTPNNDSVNDRWVLPQKLIEDPELEVIICDSYGTPVLKTRNYNNSWPESSDQLATREPNYYYILNKGGRSIQKGVITLVR